MARDRRSIVAMERLPDAVLLASVAQIHAERPEASVPRNLDKVLVQQENLSRSAILPVIAMLMNVG